MKRGFVLIIVLVVVMLALMVATSLLFVLTTEHTAAAAGARGDQVRAAAMSGVWRALLAAADAASGASQWQDNPATFRDQLVYDDGVQKWYFSVYSVTESGGVRFGLTDEASKINIYHATESMLEALPNLTAPLAQGLLSAAGGGASSPPLSDTNQQAAVGPGPPPATNRAGRAAAVGPGPPSATNQADLAAAPVAGQDANRPLACLDELMQVSGFTAPLLYGNYTNLTGRADSQADSLAAVLGPDPDSQQNIGLNQLLTVSTYDLNQDNEGRPRIDVNKGDLSSLGLSEATLAFLKVLRQNGPPLANPADLLDAAVKSKDAKGKEAQQSSPLSAEELAILLDRCTATNQAKLTGLVNLNTASTKVLAALPGLNETLAEAIVSARVGLSPDAGKTPAWLYQEGLLNADAFKQVAPYLTTRPSQFHFLVAAYAIPAGNYCILEAIVDAVAKPPALLFLRDVSRLGLPFNPNVPADQDSQPTASEQVSAGQPFYGPSPGPQGFGPSSRPLSRPLSNAPLLDKGGDKGCAIVAWFDLAGDRL